jgi:hypothetical protein
METSLSYTAHGWGHCTILADSKTVRFEWSGRMMERPVSAEEWDAFCSLLESVGAWTWEGRYDEDVVCGTPWHLELKRGEQLVSCRGNGCHHAPPGFDQLDKAMQELVRDLKFFRLL